MADYSISRSHGEDIIVLWVGRDTAATKFYVDADLVIQHSEFISAALKDRSKEAEERTVRLLDLSAGVAAAFESFQSFLCAGNVISGQTDERAEFDERKEDEEWNHLVDSWILGNVLLSGSFKDAVADAMVHKSTKSVPLDIYTNLYLNSPDSSPVRKLMADIAVHVWDEEDILPVQTDDDDPAVQAKFWRDVAVALFKAKHLPETERAKNPIESSEGGCRYHEHGADKSCYKTLFE